MRRVALISLILGQLLSGCADLTHLTRTRSLSDDTAILVDAKQRGIFARNSTTCAEPSPDALSALAVSQGANLQTKGTSVGETMSLAEAAGSIGLRTQSIQLMRDHMYRLCEAYQNKAINELTFQLLHRRFQTEMVAILAIEQLTGAIRAPAVVLGGSSTTGNADAVVKLTSSRETAAAAVVTAQSDLATKQKSEADAKSAVAVKQASYDAADSAGKAAAKAALDDASTKLAAATTDRLSADDVLAGRKAAVAAIDRSLTLAQASGSATANGTLESIQLRGPADIAAVATAVENIVKATMGQTNTSDFCTLVLAQSALAGSKVDTGSQTYKACLQLLSSGSLRIF